MLYRGVEIPLQNSLVDEPDLARLLRVEPLSGQEQRPGL